MHYTGKEWKIIHVYAPRLPMRRQCGFCEVIPIQPQLIVSVVAERPGATLKIDCDYDCYRQYIEPEHNPASPAAAVDVAA